MTSVSPILDMYRITAEHMQSNSFSIPVQIRNDTNQNIETLALIDSGAGGKFIDQNYAWKLGVKIQKLEQPLIARNVDRTRNKKEKLLPLLILISLSTEGLNELGCSLPD